MVLIEEIADYPAEEEQPLAEQEKAADSAESRSDERFRDADEIETATAGVVRPGARLHVQQLLTKLRKEGQALQRVAASGAAAAAESDGSEEKKADATAVPSTPPTPQVIPKRTPALVPPSGNMARYQTFPTFQVDMGSYNSATISLYLPLDSIGTHDKSRINCDFTATSFDLIVTDFHSKNYRIVNDNLDKDIDAGKSKFMVKPNKIIIKLAKVKGEYGYESWTALTAKKKKKPQDKANPAAGIMDLMKDMYDGGDDQMKKMIGETMYKQRTGQMNDKDPMGGMGDMMGGMDV